MNRFVSSLVIIFLSFLIACGGESSESGNMESSSPEITDAMSTADVRADALNGQIEEIRTAAEQGIDLHEPDSLGRTALMFASYNGHDDVVRFLIENGGEVTKSDSEGRTPLIFAASGPFPDTVELLLANGADPDVKDSAEGWTPLMYAASEGNEEVVQILLDHGANISILDNDGDSALDFARNNGHLEVVSLLEENL